jgi:tryptophanyl-tRNA synthetase
MQSWLCRFSPHADRAGVQNKLSLADDTNVLDDTAKAKLKLGLFSYPVLQAADVLLYR